MKRISYLTLTVTAVLLLACNTKSNQTETKAWYAKNLGLETGVTILDTIETYDYGKFVPIMDSDGNTIEL